MCSLFPRAIFLSFIDTMIMTLLEMRGVYRFALFWFGASLLTFMICLLFPSVSVVEYFQILWILLDIVCTIKHIVYNINVKNDCLWKRLTHYGLENGSLGFIGALYKQ